MTTDNVCHFYCVLSNYYCIMSSAGDNKGRSPKKQTPQATPSQQASLRTGTNEKTRVWTSCCGRSWKTRLPVHIPVYAGGLQMNLATSSSRNCSSASMDDAACAWFQPPWQRACPEEPPRFDVSICPSWILTLKTLVDSRESASTQLSSAALALSALPLVLSFSIKPGWISNICRIAFPNIMISVFSRRSWVSFTEPHRPETHLGNKGFTLSTADLAPNKVVHDSKSFCDGSRSVVATIANEEKNFHVLRFFSSASQSCNPPSTPRCDWCSRQSLHK